MSNKKKEIIVAYIVSMKRGLPSFVWNEIDKLMDLGVGVAIFPTRLGNGLYMPKANWLVYKRKVALILLRQPLFFIRHPLKYLYSLTEAFLMRSLKTFFFAMDFVSVMKKWKIDVIHCEEGLHALAIGYFCKKMLDLSMSVRVHNAALYLYKKWPMKKIGFKSADSIITITEYNKKLLLREPGPDKQKIIVIRHAIDLNRFSPKFDGLNHQTIRILIVSYFAARKGYPSFLRAVRIVNRKNLVAWIIGPDTSWVQGDYIDVKKIVMKFNLENKVKFLGGLRGYDIVKAYQNCDIFCLPATTPKDGVKEGLPVVLVEAMACGKPVISTRHAGIPELVPEDSLVDENDHVALAEMIERLIDNPQLRIEQGKRNRMIVEKDYSLKNIEILKDLFLQIKYKDL